MSIDLNAPEVQEAIKQAVENATKPILDKRDELLGEVKKLRKESAIKPEDLERIEQERDEFKAQLDKANKLAKDSVKAAEDARKALEAESGFTQKLLIDNGLSEVLVKAGVSNPAHLKAVKSMLANQVQIIADGDNRVAKVGDKALADYVTEWATSDEGKHFVSAPNNSGGGAEGGGKKPNNTAKQIPRSQFDALSFSDQKAFSLDGGKIVD